MSNTLTNPLTGLPITSEQLAQVAKLAEQQVGLESRIELLQAALETASESLRRLSQETMPALMQELGLSSFTLSSGARVDIKPFIAAKIPDDMEGRAFAWLRSNNYDSIIKRKIDVALGKGEDKLAERIVKGLQKLKVAYNDKQSIHPQTLKAFCRERIEAGDGQFPRELFGVFEGKLTKITPATK